MRTFRTMLSAGALGLALLAPVNPAIPADAPAARVILILDASGSMWGQVDGKNKILIAREAVTSLTKNWDKTIAIGLMAYGHRSKGDCADIETLVQPALGAASQVNAMAQKISPKGMTPISAAVRAAADKLKDSEEKATIILVTDGLETCNADPCALGKSLKDSGVDLKVHVIGFDLKNENTKAIQCLAEETGGQYIPADHAGDLVTALNTVVTEVKKEAVAPPPPPSVPEVKKPAADNIRIFLAPGVPVPEKDTARFDYFPPDQTDNAKIIKTEYGNPGTATLPPGKYAMRIHVGAVERRVPLEITDKRDPHDVVLDAGIIALDALLGQAIKIDTQTLTWQVYRVGANGQPAAETTAYEYGPTQRLILPAGDYILKARLGDAHRTVGFSIKAGEFAQKTIDMRAGRVHFDARYSATSTPVTETLYWQAFEAGPRSDPAAYSYGDKGVFTLTAGDYVLAYSVSGVKGEVKVRVEPDKDVNATAIMNAARIVFESSLAPDGPKLAEDSQYWEAKDATGKMLTYAYSSNPNFLVPAGTLTIQVSIGAVKRNQALSLKPGETLKRRLPLNAGYVKYSATGKGKPFTGTPFVAIYPVRNNTRAADGVGYNYNAAGTFIVPAGDYDVAASSGPLKGVKRITVKPGATVVVAVDAK